MLNKAQYLYDGGILSEIKYKNKMKWQKYKLNAESVLHFTYQYLINLIISSI